MELESITAILQVEKPHALQCVSGPVFKLGFENGYDKAIEIIEGMKEAEELVAEAMTPERIKKKNATVAFMFLHGARPPLDDIEKMELVRAFELVIKYIKKEYL